MKKWIAYLAILVIVMTVTPALAGNGKGGGYGKGGKNASGPTVPAPPSEAPVDETAPTVKIGSPGDGAKVSASITLAGSASDAVGVTSVDARIDGGAWQRANGTSDWSLEFDTTRFSDGTYTITVRASDNAGNSGTASISLAFSNAPAPTTTSPTRMVTPEGVTIDVNSTGPWTAEQIYGLLKQSAIDLDKVGPTLTIKVQDASGSGTVTNAGGSGGTYTTFKATMYLKGVNSTFSKQPDSTIAHEYGHAWSLYHLYMTRAGDWSSYLRARWSSADGSTTLASDPRLGSSYDWDRAEIIADDYRLLFGSATAVSQRPSHMNTVIPEPADVPGLRNFLLNAWG